MAATQDDAGTKVKELMSKHFTTAEEVVALYNDVQTTPEDKSYLNDLVDFMLKEFVSRSKKGKSHFNAVAQLAKINDEDVFRSIVNVLTGVCKQELLINPYVLQGLAQISLESERFKLSIQDVESLLELLSNKINREDVANLEAFGMFVDAIVDTNITGVDEQVIKSVVEKLDNWLKKATSEEIKYRLAYNKQALLHIGNNVRTRDVVKRKAIACLEGLVDFTAVGCSIASIGMSMGATAPEAAPAIIKGLISGSKHMADVFKPDGKKEWYNELRELREGVCGCLCAKENFSQVELEALADALNSLQDSKLVNIRLDLVKTLKRIIEIHPNIAVKNLCVQKLAINYTNENKSWLQEKILKILVSCEKNEELKVTIKETIAKLNLEVKYEETKKNTSPIQETEEAQHVINIIKANEKILGKEKRGKTVTAYCVEPGGEVVTLEDNEVTGVNAAMHIGQNLTPDEVELVKTAETNRQKAFQEISEIKAAIVPKGAKVGTAKGNVSTGFDMSTNFGGTPTKSDRSHTPKKKTKPRR